MDEQSPAPVSLLCAGEPGLYPDLVQERKQNLPEHGLPRAHRQQRPVSSDCGEQGLVNEKRILYEMTNQETK